MRHFVSRLLAMLVITVGLAMIVVVAGYVGSELADYTEQFAPLIGAFLGGSLTLWGTRFPENRIPDPWERRERLSWLLIGAGCILWGVGESFWRYYISIGQTPFPSFADIGYASFPVLVFVGLLLQPSPGTTQRKIMIILDSIIATGTVFAHAWYFALGRLVLAADDMSLAHILAIYYPAADAVLLSCVIILLLRGQRPLAQSTRHRVALAAVGIGLFFFVVSDFVFHTRQNASSYAWAPWLHLGWPLGMMIIGITAHFHRFPLAVPTTWKVRLEQAVTGRSLFSPMQLLPYILLVCLFVVLLANGLTEDRIQQTIRPVLLLVTLFAVCLVITRLTITMWENMRLMQRQATLLEDQIEDQRDINAQVLAANAELASGIDHMQEVLTKLANGDWQARVNLPKGNLWPLGQSINILANRLARAAGKKPSQQNPYGTAPSSLTDKFPVLRKNHNYDQEY